MKLKNVEQKIEIPEGIKAEMQDGILTSKGPKGEAEKSFVNPKIKIVLQGTVVNIAVDERTKKENKVMNSFEAHIRNMIRGVQNNHAYKLKVCSSHFPMNISVSNNQFIIKNFIGEKVPRVIKIAKGAKVEVAGSEIIVTSASKEAAGQMAASIEQMTRRKGYDTRIFQDGIYITEKDGKQVG